MPSKHGWQMSAVWLGELRKRRVYLHITIGAGLSTGQRSALGHGDAALAHLTAEVIPLVSHWALQGTVFSQVGAGVIWKSWGRGHVITLQQFIKGRSCYGGCLGEHSHNQPAEISRYICIHAAAKSICLYLLVWHRHEQTCKSCVVHPTSQCKTARSSTSGEMYRVHACVGH